MVYHILYEHNLNLSQSRSESVRQYIIDQGVGEERLSAQGYGESSPVDTNRTKAGRGWADQNVTR